MVLQKTWQNQSSYEILRIKYIYDRINSYIIFHIPSWYELIVKFYNKKRFLCWKENFNPQKYISLTNLFYWGFRILYNF